MRRLGAPLLAFALVLLAPVVSAQDAGTDVAEAGPEEAPTQGVSLAEQRASAPDVPLWQRGVSLLGLGVMVGLAWAMSTRRDQFPVRVVAWGIGLQLLFGVLVLKTSVGLAVFSFLNDVVTQLLRFTDDGSRFLFGAYLESEFTVALNVLPTIIFFSSLMSVLY
ncbi:MAG: hypothetical protein KC619_11160, partial [Myxococcales bacterium]|nr:hypothetical protein [Myxococcales bacterium]